MGIPKMRSLLVLIGSLSSSPVVTDSVSVTTDKGTLRGTSRNVNGVSVSSYLGVPFAQPPVNDLRFAAPQEESAWSGEWDATFKRPLCSQPANCSGCDVETTAEDCLYLNVFAPTELPEEPLPVYYWIHGGSFTGDWHPKWYNGEQLVGHGGVILVTVNYRLGALGFLSTGDGVIRGNQGMLDQQLGLDWIRTHIHHFGGDKAKVTIHGQSAGAISCKYHAISPMSGSVDQPKFANVIVHSGQQMAYNAEPAETVQSFARNSGCLTEFLISSERFAKCIRALPIDDIVAASDQERAVQFMMGPILDRLYNLDTENAQFWIDLETLYLPNGNIEFATANDWRAAYIALGMDTGYTSYAYEIAD